MSLQLSQYVVDSKTRKFNSFYVTWLLSQSIKNLQITFLKTSIIQIMTSPHPSIPNSDAQLIDSFLHQKTEGCSQFGLEQPCIDFEGRTGQRKGRRYRKSCWSLSQNLKYRQFLLSKGHLMEGSLEDRRESQVNKMLSLHLKTRSPDQCRSHHQKMHARHRSIAAIVEYIDQLARISPPESRKMDHTDALLSRKLRIRSQKLRKDKVDQWIDCIWYSGPSQSEAK